jgi:hypothetical protein
MKHVFKLDEWGDKDDFALSIGNHNGPKCVLCCKNSCQHCTKWEDEDCPAVKHQIDNALKEIDNKIMILEKQKKLIIEATK